MKYRLKFRPEASADIAEAFSWYEQQRAGLGAEFETELNRHSITFPTCPWPAVLCIEASDEPCCAAFPSRSISPSLPISSRFVECYTIVAIPGRGSVAREA